jgi:hypothetical protein
MTLLRKYVFFHFLRFTDFERAVTLLLVKIFLNFKNCSKAMSKLFLKPFINFFFPLSLHAQNTVWIRVSCPIFAVALWCNREYWGWGGCEEAAFSIVYMPILGMVWKELLLLDYSCKERYPPQAAEGRKAQFGLGFSALMPNKMRHIYRQGTIQP